ncbi:MAG: hypothetical protein ACR2P6_02305 [Gammaproteobacteria bacterium]
MKKRDDSARSRTVGALATLALVLSTVGFYTAIYDVEQEADFLQIAKEYPDDKDCGSAWTHWFPAGSGLVNPCKKGCYRGTTLRQQIKMVNFPPWPVTRREIQCWVRKPTAVASMLENGNSKDATQ